MGAWPMLSATAAPGQRALIASPGLLGVYILWDLVNCGGWTRINIGDHQEPPALWGAMQTSLKGSPPTLSRPSIFGPSDWVELTAESEVEPAVCNPRTNKRATPRSGWQAGRRNAGQKHGLGVRSVRCEGAKGCREGLACK